LLSLTKHANSLLGNNTSVRHNLLLCDDNLHN
jgi:hypothetical protein